MIEHANLFSVLLQKVPAMVKPFIPQLQRTFLKYLGDESSDIRELAEQCMEAFIPLQPRVDPLVTELCNTIKNGEDSGIQASFMYALGEVVNVASISDASKELVTSLVKEFQDHEDGTLFSYKVR